MTTNPVRADGPQITTDTAGLEFDEARVEQMAGLLRRYPSLDEADKATLLHFLRKGRQIEIGMVSARDGVAERLAAFRMDHREHFRLGLTQILGFVALIIGPLAVLAWACLG
ncbi:hypothetical protein [Sphingosinicella sp. CPCC 101087]|uniref:hypothetical protein n=1 Tax=Sphingosinicella sp. CPCC 101087 TaxID=2497754 RepID=UPI00101BCA4B|nr:hypothetical protein [Sphingosinicella sp. CPCC 101087]